MCLSINSAQYQILRTFAITDDLVVFCISLLNFRYTCNGGATFSDGSTEKHATCENNNGTMEWSDIGDECRTGKGACTCDVCKIFGFFDPLPLVIVTLTQLMLLGDPLPGADIICTCSGGAHASYYLIDLLELDKLYVS